MIVGIAVASGGAGWRFSRRAPWKGEALWYPTRGRRGCRWWPAVVLALLAAGRMGEALSLYEGAAGLAVLGGGLLVASHVLSERMARIRRAACCP